MNMIISCMHKYDIHLNFILFLILEGPQNAKETRLPALQKTLVDESANKYKNRDKKEGANSNIKEVYIS